MNKKAFAIVTFLICWSFPIFGQHFDFELISHEKVDIPPKNKELASLSKIYIEPIHAHDSIYTRSIQSLFYSDHYQFVPKVQADWVLKFGTDTIKGSPILGYGASYAKSTRPSVKTARSTKDGCNYTGTMKLVVDLKLYDSQNQLIDSIYTNQTVGVTSRNFHFEVAALADYYEELDNLARIVIKEIFKKDYLQLAPWYFVTPREFPIYSVTPKSYDKYFADWIKASNELIPWSQNKPIDTLSTQTQFIVSILEKELPKSYDKMLDPNFTKAHIYYQLAVFNYLRQRYSESYEYMAQAYNTYQLLDNRLLQLWYTLNVYREQGVF